MVGLHRVRRLLVAGPARPLNQNPPKAWAAGEEGKERSSAILALLKIDVYDKDGDINTEVYICTSNVNPYKTILYPENYHVQFGIIMEDLQNKICT